MFGLTHPGQQETSDEQLDFMVSPWVGLLNIETALWLRLFFAGIPMDL